MAKLPAQSSAVKSPTAPERTSLGLTSRQAALLAYSAGWISGVLVLWLEARDRPSRWHAAQSVLGFGMLSLLAAATLGVAVIGLLSSLTLFRVGLWATQIIVGIGFGFWAWSLARVAFGGAPRWPLLGDRVDRLAEPR